MLAVVLAVMMFVLGDFGENGQAMEIYEVSSFLVEWVVIPRCVLLLLGLVFSVAMVVVQVSSARLGAYP